MAQEKRAPKIGFTDEFSKACQKLDNADQQKTHSAIKQFITEIGQQVRSSGQNFEALKNSSLYSIRVNDSIRIILYWHQEDNAYILLYVGHHQDAYNWADKARVEKNETATTLQLYRSVTVQEEAKPPEEHRLFQQYSDKDLKSIGLPEAQLPLVRTIRDEEQLRLMSGVFPEAVAEYLTMLAEGAGMLSEIQEIVREHKAASGGDVMKNPDTLRSIAIGYLDPELEHIINEGVLAAWRVFLHPMQRRLVHTRFDGPALVLGGAGTGKTVTALHRAKALAARMVEAREAGKVLFTFFNDYLIEDISSMLRSICTAEEFRCIRIQNIDKEIFQRLREVPGYEQASIVYPGAGSDDKALDKLWADAVSAGDPEGRLSVRFYREEWEQVIVEKDARTLEDYLKVERIGRKKPLYPDARRQVWNVFEAYRKLMRERRLLDNKSATDVCRRYVAGLSEAPYRYVVVDEAQDFSACALRLVRALAGPEHDDDLFLVGDTHQRIYNQRTSLASCGIRVQGRTRSLHMNYRTTHEIQQSAVHLLEGQIFDDLNGGTDLDSGYRSCRAGDVPQVRAFASQEEECRWIRSEIDKLTDSGISPADICLTAPTRQMYEGYVKTLKALPGGDFRIYALKSKSKDDRDMDGIRVGTMHRVKGLEFKYMFIAGINAGTFPANPADQVRTKQQRCLMYVALTRAQLGAYVSGWGKAPSPFLTELMELEED